MTIWMWIRSKWNDLEVSDHKRTIAGLHQVIADRATSTAEQVSRLEEGISELTVQVEALQNRLTEANRILATTNTKLQSALSENLHLHDRINEGLAREAKLMETLNSTNHSVADWLARHVSGQSLFTTPPAPEDPKEFADYVQDLFPPQKIHGRDAVRRANAEWIKSAAKDIEEAVRAAERDQMKQSAQPVEG